MVIIGLLLIALICLILGLILQSAVWLIASLIATGGAAYLLYKLRNVIAVPKSARRPLPPELSQDAAKVALVPARSPTTSREALDEPDTDDEAPAADDEPAADDATAAADAPAAVEAPPTVDTDTDADEVWVIDGRPRYHLGDCAIIKGQDAEAISYDQATEDGFMPCSLCEPHAARTW